MQAVISCTHCGLPARPIPLRARYDNETFEHWMGDVADGAEVTHALLSPACAAPELRIALPLFDDLRGLGYARSYPSKGLGVFTLGGAAGGRGNG